MPEETVLPALTTKQRRDYVKKGGVRCPFCDSYDLQGDDTEFDGGRVTQEVRCADCDREWRDVYILATVCETDIQESTDQPSAKRPKKPRKKKA